VCLLVVVAGLITLFSAVDTTIQYAMYYVWTVRDCGLHVGRVTRRWLGPWIMRILGITVVYRGLENLKDGVNYVLMSEHGSLLDTPLLLMIPSMRFIAKNDVFLPIRWLGWRSQIFVDRSDGKAMDVIREAIGEWSDSNMIFFGEGTRSVTGEVQELKLGGITIAYEFGRSIIPVHVDGAREALPKNRSFLAYRRGKTVTVTIGKPIPPCRGREEFKAAAEAVRQAILDLR